MELDSFDVCEPSRDELFLRTAKKKRRTSVEIDEENEDETSFRDRLRIGLSPERMADTPSQSAHDPKRSKNHSNYNPFATSFQEAPSLLSISTGESSPEPLLNMTTLSTNGSPRSVDSPAQQTHLCNEFNKTLSIVEFVDETRAVEPSSSSPGPTLVHDSMAESPATPPSSSMTPLRRFPQSVNKTLRIQHWPQVGDMVKSRFEEEFEILERIGGGSFGTVFKVRKRIDGIMYAVKVVNQSFHGKTGRERVLKEVYALAALVNSADNSHILRYFSSWIDVDSKLYIQTELCDQSLEELLKARNHHQAPKDHELEEMACDILRQLLEGLKGLHCANVVHLDIKPANILVKNGTYKLGDLGHVAKARSESEDLPEPPTSKFPGGKIIDDEDELQIRAANSVAVDIDEGDVRYMARELLNSHDHLPKADIFSLAISIYEMFLQKPLPLNGDEWHRLRDGHLAAEATRKMSPNFRQLMHVMMHPDPAKRPSADDLLTTGGPGGILLPPLLLKRHAEQLRGLHPAHAVLKRANTM